MKKIFVAGLVCAMLWIACGGDEETGLPEVSIIFPVDGSVVSGTVEITADASDDVGIMNVDFYIDSLLVSTDSTEPYTHSWETYDLVDSSSHTIYATAYDTDTNEASSEMVTVTVYIDNSFDESDNFNAYPYSQDTTYVLLDGNGNWSSIDWYIMREDTAFDSNYVMVREFPLSPTNHATYHLTAPAVIESLTVGFAYIQEANGEISVFVSPNDTDYVDVTGEFGISTTTTPVATSADLTTFVTDYGADAYIRFEASASGGTAWHSAIDDFWVSGTVE
jgi:hypothetical protein